MLGRVEAVVVDDATATPELLELAGSAAVLSLGDCPGADDLLAAPDDGLPITVEARAHDVARVNFTSGSSGRPKGCAWSYEALHPAFDPSRWPPDLARLISCFERCLVYGSWSMPAMMTFAGRSLLVGGTVVVGAKDERPDLPHAIERHRISGASRSFRAAPDARDAPDAAGRRLVPCPGRHRLAGNHSTSGRCGSPTRPRGLAGIRAESRE